MATDLMHHIQETPLIDTHEHLHKEREYTENGPDVLRDLFDNYVTADLVVAGATPEAIERLIDSSDPDLGARFAGVRDAWARCKHTGYGEAVRSIAKHVYDMDEITLERIEAAQGCNAELRRPGARRRLLKEVANLDHVQIDDFCWPCLPDASGPDFFLYDISWEGFSKGEVDARALYDETGVEVDDLDSLRQAMAALFAKYGPCAIAVKSQHAYARTLRWHEHDESDVARALHKRLAGGELTDAERLCLGDWCLARGVELAVAHNLPFKIHTGYHAGHSYSQMDHIRPSCLCLLLAKYPQARFVLMHISYPYNDEVVALAKHYPNVYVDLCWAWSINPHVARDFARSVIHAAPSHKLFAFGGDTFWPNAAVAYARQARQWLNRALQAEVDEGMLTEREAIDLATRFMQTNQRECFDIEGTRAAIRTAMQGQL